MSRDWEATLRSWTKKPSDAEDVKRERTEKAVRDALNEYGPIPNSSMRVFAQGSYKNNTNVRLDYDVDIGVEYQEGERSPTLAPSISTFQKFFAAKDLSNEALGMSATVPKSYDPKWFKNHIEAALVLAFGRPNIVRHGKCIKVAAGGTRLPADVVPCFPHRRYDSATAVHRGIRIFPDTGAVIENYPDQHYANGCAKNDRTGRRYKRMARALKRMENHLVSKGVIEEVPSFLIECLVYNVPDTMFVASTYVDDFVTVARHIWWCTYEPARSSEWVEVSGLKYLFRPGQPWTVDQARSLCWAAYQAVSS